MRARATTAPSPSAATAFTEVVPMSTPTVTSCDTALIAWRDREGAAIRGFAAHMSASGTVAEPGGFLLADGASPNSVTVGPGGGYSVVYQRAANEAPFGGAIHGFVRTVSPK